MKTGQLLITLLMSLIWTAILISILKIEPSSDAGFKRLENYLKKSIDKTSKPCDDFYQYACGNAYQNMSRKELNVSWFYEIQDKVKQQITKLLEDNKTYPSNADPNDGVLSQLRKYYTSCKNETRLKELGSKPLLDLLGELTPFDILIANKSNRPEDRINSKDYFNKIIKLKSLGIDNNKFSIQINMRPKEENSSTYAIYIGPNRIYPMDNVFLVNKTYRDLDMSFMLDSIYKLAHRNKSLAKQEVEELQELRMQYIKIQAPLDADIEYKNMTVKEFESIKWEHDFPYHVKQLFMEDKTNLTDDDIVNVDLEYLQELDRLMKKTEPRIIDNYILYKLLRSYRNYLDSSWAQDKDCISLIQDDFAWELGQEYILHFVDHKSLRSIWKVLLGLTDSIKELIREETSFFQGGSKDLALKKFDQLAVWLAYWASYMRRDFRTWRTSHINLTSDNFFENLLVKSKYDINSTYRSIGPYLRFSNAPFYVSTIANAFYNPGAEHMVIIPAAIIQNRVFNRNGPSYFNYGVLGFVISHEMGHAFDSNNIIYDEGGNKNNWLDEKTSTQFELKKKCFIDQYDNLTISSYLNEYTGATNGTLTLSENMADNYGIWAAYKAFKESEKRDYSLLDEPVLAGFKYTRDQLFWLSYATVFCDAPIQNKQQMFLSQLETHSPAKYRVNIPLANSPNFAEAFNCPPGSPMNPVNKCLAWQAI